MMFIVRRHWSDPNSETIARESNYHRAVQEAMTQLQENDRDYEAFDVVEVDDDGEVVNCDYDCVSWEPRG